MQRAEAVLREQELAMNVRLTEQEALLQTQRMSVQQARLEAKREAEAAEAERQAVENEKVQAQRAAETLAAERKALEAARAAKENGASIGAEALASPDLLEHAKAELARLEVLIAERNVMVCPSFRVDLCPPSYLWHHLGEFWSRFISSQNGCHQKCMALLCSPHPSTWRCLNISTMYLTILRVLQVD
jgi:hypothetical protein